MDQNDEQPGSGVRPSPGSSDPGDPGYEGEVTVGDDAVEGLVEAPDDAEGEPPADDAD